MVFWAICVANFKNRSTIMHEIRSGTRKCSEFIGSALNFFEKRKKYYDLNENKISLKNWNDNNKKKDKFHWFFDDKLQTAAVALSKYHKVKPIFKWNKPKKNELVNNSIYLHISIKTKIYYDKPKGKQNHFKKLPYKKFTRLYRSKKNQNVIQELRINSTKH